MVESAADASHAPSPSPEGDLGQVAWWATEQLGFGVIPEAPPDPNPPAMPNGFRQLSVGTLDGRVTAILALHSEWAHSYVAGPYGTDVLVANDTGTASEVFLVSALDGHRTDLFTSPEIVAAAALGDDGASVYYVEVGRQDGRDRGLLRRARDRMGAPEEILPGPIGEPQPDPAMYWLTADPLEGRVVVQHCFGQVRCRSVAVDPATGRTVEDTGLGWPLGGEGSIFFAAGLGASDATYAWDMRSGVAERIEGAGESVPVRLGASWRFVRDDGPEGPTQVIGPGGERSHPPGEDPPGSSMLPLGERRGVALPPGWVLRWPPIPIWQLGEPMGLDGLGQLIHAGTGERVGLETFEPHVAEGETCEVPIPSTMPDGREPGFAVLELLDGHRSVRWGEGDDAVRVAIGVAVLGPPSELDDGMPVTVRGHDGRAILIGDEGLGEAAFSWAEGGCDYTAWLAPGTTLDEAVEYAGRY